MKTIKKILIVSLLSTIPVVTFAEERCPKNIGFEKINCIEEEFEFEPYNDLEEDLIASFEIYDKADINLVFEGRIISMPKIGYNGIWNISGKTVEINNQTKIFIHKNIDFIDKVDVYAKREDGKIKAIMIDQK